MSHPKRIFRLLHGLLVVALLFGYIPPTLYAQDNVYLPLVTGGETMPTTHLLFRTRVTVATSAQWRDLSRLDLLILDKGTNWALVLVTDRQLTDLARLRYNPEQTHALATLVAANASLHSAPGVQQLLRLEQESGQAQAAQTEQVRYATLQSALHSLSAAATAQLAQATGADSDNDGLSDDQEGFWCTDPARADSDFDGAKDGAEVTALKAWLGNQRAQFPSTGKPFQGWPSQKQNCFDDDQDAVPDLAEALELGLNPGRESTDRDKFDDGQELFGQTYCTGQGGFCSYGPLPRNEDWGVIFAEMPSWVKAPGNHPLVAGFPVPEVDVVVSSLKVELVTTITDGETILSGIEKSYSTAKTEGTSTSIANTKTWNEWEEVAESLQQNLPTLHASTTLSIDSTLQIGGFWGKAGKFGLGTLKIVGGVGGAFGGCAVGTGMTTTLIGAVPGVALCGAAIAGGVAGVVDGFSNIGEAFAPDEAQQIVQPNIYQNTEVRLENQVALDNEVNVVMNQSFDTGSIVNALNANRYAQIQTGQLISQRLYEIGSIFGAPKQTTSQSKGRSWGGSQTTTHEIYEEHTVTNGEAFLTQESWSKTTAIDSAHAADLWFTYKVRNTGTEYAREIANLAFNLYIGDPSTGSGQASNPAYTYFVAPDIGGNGKFQNFMPNEEHTYTSRRIPLSLDQMKAIDLGGPIRIVVEDFTYGIDELFYQDAANAGVLIALEDGADDGDESIDTYLIPTWGQESVLNVLARYFPHETDTDGTIIAIWTPEYRTDTPTWCQAPRRPTDFPNKALWCKHVLSTADWWNVYTDGLSDGAEGFQDTPAAPGSVALFRFNQDSDLDGFSDRSEARLGTDPNDAASFPHPELLAGVHSIKAGNKVTSTLSLLNTGIYDAYGVEAVMVAPDDSISITNNTVGGSGRVRALKQVIVGSGLKLPSPLPGNWAQAGHAVPAVGGYYTGNEDRTYSFVVACGEAAGCVVGSGTWSVNWSDGKGATGQLNFGAGYQSPTFLPVGNLGMTLAFYSGKVSNGESIAVTARTPRDTFQYTINREPHTPPLVIVSYNDPQGNHRFVIPTQAMSLIAPTDNLNQFTGEMLHDVGVEIVTSAPFAAGANSAKLLVNNPADKTLSNARLFLEVINISGTVVAEIPSQVTLPPGPTYTTVTFNTSSFTPAYKADEDYIVMAFLTDYQGNILDMAGRPLSSFQADPLPQLAVDNAALTWNFGTVNQGTLVKYPIPLANTGFGRLYTYLPPGNGLTLNRASRTVGAADMSDYELTLRTADLPVGPVDRTITIATSDPANPTLSLRVLGTITAGTSDTAGGSTRPLDLAVNVPGSHSQGEWYEFTQSLGPDAQGLHPVKVYSQDYGTLYGVGRYATEFGAGTASNALFGAGKDGDITISSDITYDPFRTPLGVASVAAGQRVIQLNNASGFHPGYELLIHQVRGSGAGNYEFVHVVAKSGNEITLRDPLKHTYTHADPSVVQVINVPHYRNVTVTGTGIWRVPAWDGITGGLLVFRASGNVIVEAGGLIDASGRGFRGGTYWAGRGGRNGQGEGTGGAGNAGSANANGNGGGGGRQESGDKRFDYGGGGGGGNGASGSNAQNQGAQGGSSSGAADFSTFVFGGGGGVGGGPYDDLAQAGSGGSGGGAILIFGRQIAFAGTLLSNGTNGGNRAGGGGAGGSMLFAGGSVLLNGTIQAQGGNGESSHDRLGYGGNGGVGRIRIEYCESLTGTTNPPASTQKLNCYIVEQVESVPYTTARLNLPETFANGRTYHVQFSRKLDFVAAGSQVTTLRVPAGLYSSAQLDALVSGLAANATLSIDVGNDGAVEWNNSVANNSTTTLNGLADALNVFWRAQGSPTTGTLDLPIKVTTTQPGQVLLTNLQITTTGSRLRHIRLPVRTYTRFLLDFTAGSGGTVALDIGDNGSIDWSSALDAPRQLTANLKDALNAYLSGKSGQVDVPIRFYVAPFHNITLNDYQATSTVVVDLVADTISVGATMQASGLHYNEGDSVPVQATLRNSSSTDSGPVTAAFFAHAEGWGDWYIGSSLINNIAAGGSAQVSAQWNTTGFGSDQPVVVKVVVNPYGRQGETSFANNSKTTNVTVAPVKVDQVITFDPIPEKKIGDPAFGVNPSASSALAVVITALTTGVCTVNGNSVTLVGAGTCILRAEQAGNAFFNPAAVERSFVVKDPLKTDQSITFAPLNNRKLSESPITLTASASSSLAVNFTSLTPIICAVNGNQVTLLAVGTCTIRASQEGNGQFNAAPLVEQSFQVNPHDKLDQSITFHPLPDKTYGDAPFSVSGAASSGLAVSFAALTTTVCTSNGNTITLVGAGLCTIRALQSGDATYNPAAAVERTFTVYKANQSILFGSLSDKLTTDAAFTISASASSGLAVAFTTQTPPVCTIVGDVVTLLDKGLCTIRATQPGNDNYNAASSLEQSFVVRNPTLTNQAITFDPLPDMRLGEAPFTLTATASSGLAVTFVTQTPAVCTVEGETVTLLAAGFCTIQATQAGNDRFNPATPVTRTFQVVAPDGEEYQLYLPVVKR